MNISRRAFVNTSSQVIARLQDALGSASVITDADVIATNSTDRANFCQSGNALALVRPSTADEVSAVVSIAGDAGVPIVPQGALTGLSGGANAIDGSILLSTSRLNAIVEVDVRNQVAVVQPGVTNGQLSAAVAEHGLFYPPDPSSWQSSSIGGNVATNAGGLCCVKYGVTADYVLGLEVVTGTGDILRVGRRTAKGVAGYNLTQLMVGSEGTLGVITEITLALRPAPPQGLTVAALFNSASEALRAAEDIMASGLRPSMAEFLDGFALDAIQKYRDLGLPANLGGMLIIESDRGELAAADIASVADICAKAGAIEVVPAESHLLHEARRLALPAIESLGAALLIDDVAVPRTKLVALLEGLESISARSGLRIITAGHVGDGNMHPVVIFDRGTDDERARSAFEDIMNLGLSLGGTVTGEHGVGLLKRAALARELGDLSSSLQRRIKTVFDPLGVMNPGKVFG